MRAPSVCPALPPLSRAEREWLRQCLEADPLPLVAAYSGRSQEELRRLIEPVARHG